MSCCFSGILQLPALDAVNLELSLNAVLVGNGKKEVPAVFM